MVWGRFSRNGVWRLLRINKNVQHYLKILKCCAVPSMQHLFGDQSTIFQQDNAPSIQQRAVKSGYRQIISTFCHGRQATVQFGPR